MAWDASTISAVAALVVACFALLIAVAQVLQQYLVTGQLIRLCDSVVFGPLPGQGRRIWEPSQLRFRVVYSIPQFSLDADLWPDNPPHVKSYAAGRHGLHSLSKRDGLQDEKLPETSSSSSMTASTTHRPRFSFALRRLRSVDPKLHKSRVSHRRVGEASWVSFWRVIERQCGDSVRFDQVEYDADRCPPDLVTAPMQVSMRDVAVMGLMAGMQLTSCSFPDKSLSMQGEVGTITSSNHPVLGPILHFTPRDVRSLQERMFAINRHTARATVESRWLSRTWDVCMVAGKYFNSSGRRTARRLDERWIRDRKGNPYFELSVPGDTHSKPRDRPREGKGKEKGKGKGKGIERDAKNSAGTAPESERSDNFKAENVDAADGSNSSTTKGLPHLIPRRLQDGPWIMTIPHDLPLYEPGGLKQDTQGTVPESKDSKRSTATPQPQANKTTMEKEREPTKVKRQPTVEDDLEDAIGADANPEDGPQDMPGSSSDLPDRIQTAKARQAARRVRLQEIERDKSLVEESVKRGAITSPYQPQPTMLLLTQYPHNPDQEQKLPKPTPAEEAARQREEERKQRDDERWERNRARNDAVSLRMVDMFWLCQMDIFYGYWATPWQNPSSVPLQSTLVGAVTVTLEALLGFLDDKSLIYTDFHPRTWESLHDTTSWLSNRRCTYPAYAINARGGVVAGGVSWLGVRIPAFKATVIPALELLHSYDWQVAPEVRDQIRHNDEFNVELMRLDSWLSYVGRTNEIADGPNKLLRQTPALISLLIAEFELDFQNMDLSASEGGLQDIQGLSANIMDFLTDEGLTEAEQLYVLVALLRAVKVGQSILAGANTDPLLDILLKDVQAHLV